MSAYLVSDAHISFIVNFANTALAKWNSLPGHARIDDPQGLGEILYKANDYSVEYRYPQSAKNAAPAWKWKPSGPIPATLENTVKFLKALDCLEYQSCEPPAWDESQAFKIIAALRGMAINALPGYNKAPWGIDA